MSLVLQYLNPTRSYSQLCTPRYDEKSSKRDDFAGYLETIQVEHLKFVVVSFLHVYYMCTKFERNLRHASVFRVDLTRNDPDVKSLVEHDGEGLKS